ncbi:MAG: virulence-associated E family protein [Stenomitos rutilans HA7619-LM2]|jgi:predicted P-loop ATPase|nr:virulence-associated E family protein [Stenomitos rutilans HA7619-LM2]
MNNNIVAEKNDTKQFSVSTLVQLHDLLESEYADRITWDTHRCEIRLDGNQINLTQLRVTIEKNNGLIVSNQDIKDLIYNFAWEKPYSEVASYLSSIYELYKDKVNVEILDFLAKNVVGAQTDLEVTYLTKFLVGAVARALEPGCKQDTALILSGKQGYRKTTFFETLAHPSRFVTINHSASNDKALKDSYKYWIIEYGELDSKLTYNNLNHLKNYMSTRRDEIKHLYVNMSETKERHFTLVGTTNKDDFLIDDTGNRRFWVVKVLNPIDTDWVEQNRDLIWACAVSLYKQGHIWHLTPEEQALSDQTNANYDVKDIWDSTVLSWVQTQTEPFTIADVLSMALGIIPGKQGITQEKRVSKILTQAGYQKSRMTPVGKERTYYWTKN